MSAGSIGSTAVVGTEGRAWQPVRWTRVVLVSAVVALLVASIGATATSAAERAFSLRYGENLRGNVAFAANTLIDCSSGSTTCRASSGVLMHDNPGANNNFRSVARVDVDADPTTETSSRAILTIPAGTEVAFAGLYWAGNPTAGYSESNSAQVDDWRQPLIQTPAGGGYQTVTADQFDSFDYADSRGNQTWSGFADVTNVVRAGGAGEYTVAGVPLRTGCFDCTVSGYGGWALWVIYEDLSQPWRNLSVFDGLAQPTQTFTVSGFTTPPSGSFNTEVGVSGVEGDWGTSGDQMRINGVELFDFLTPVNNFFTSRITRFGVDVGDRTPNRLNQLGFDAKLIDADAVDASIIPNGATDADVTITTSGDGYWANAIATAIEIFNPDVTATKSVGNADRPGALDAHPGEELEYTVTVENAAGSATDTAADVVLRDAIPAETTYVPGSLEMVSGDPAPAGSRTDGGGDDSAEYDAVGDEVVFRLGGGANAADGGMLDAGESATVRFRVTVDPSTQAGDTVVNEADAAFTGETTGEDLSTVSNEVETPITDPVVDLDLDKSATPLVDPGEEVTWTLTVSNVGPDASPGATVTDTLPPGVTNIQTSTPGCNVAASTVTCDVGPLAAGGATQIVITGDSPTTPSACFENDAMVDGDAPDPQPGNDTADARTCTTPAADLELTKTATPVVDPGGQVTWALTVINDGPNASPGATVTDTLPAGFTNIQSSTPNCSVAGSTVTCDVGPLAAGDSTGILITANAPQATATCFDNDALVTGDIGDFDPDDNDATARTCTTPTADLELAKSAPSVVDPGDQIAWTLTVTNNGADSSSGSTVTDTLPAGVTNVQSSTPGCNVAGGTVTCDVGPLAPNESTEIVITGDAPLSPSTCVDNAALVVGDEGDPRSVNDDATTRTCTSPAADLRLSKSAASVVDPGEEITWTLTVTNDGPNQSSGSTVTDTVPAGVTNVQAVTAGCTVQGNAVACDVGPLAPDESTDIVLTGDAPLTPSTCMDNNASVIGAEGDPRTGNNDASARTCTSPAADLDLAKTATATVDPGGRVTWTLTVRNDGPNQSTASTVTDALPAVVSNVATSTAGCAVQANTVTCDVGPLAPNESTEIVITGDAPQTTSTCFSNQASVHGTEGDPQLGNNQRFARTCTTPAADLGLSKIAPALVERGGEIAWKLTVTNHGPGDSTGARVVDSLPAGISDAATSTAGCTVVGSEVRCDVGPLAAGASTEITVRGKAPSAGSTCLENTATVRANGEDPVSGNNSAKASSCTTHDLSLTKTAGDERVVVGDTVNYRLEVRNNSIQPAGGIVVEDPVPSRLDVRGADSTDGECSVAGNKVRCQIDTLPGGQTAMVTVRAVATQVGTSTNTGIVISDRCASGLCHTDPAKVAIVKPKLRVAKTASKGRVRAGGTIVYAIQVTNPSKRAVRDVRVCDQLPAGMTALRGTPKGKLSKGRYCWTAKRIGARKSQRYKLTVRVLRGASGRKINTVTAAGAGVRGSARASARPVRIVPRQAVAGGVTG